MYFLKMTLHFFGKDVVLATKHLQQLPPRLSLQTENDAGEREGSSGRRQQHGKSGIKQKQVKTKSEGGLHQMLRGVKHRICPCHPGPWNRTGP